MTVKTRLLEKVKRICTMGKGKTWYKSEVFHFRFKWPVEPQNLCDIRVVGSWNKWEATPFRDIFFKGENEGYHKKMIFFLKYDNQMYIIKHKPRALELCTRWMNEQKVVERRNIDETDRKSVV